jgi:U3 small nucleolar ribonucleoprotein component
MSETIYIQDNEKKRKATAEELAQFEKDRAEAVEQARLIEAETTAKAEAKESGMAKLRKLGLTDDEIAGLIS